MIKPSTVVEEDLLRIVDQAKSLSHRYCQNRHDAEDLAQDTLLKLIINKPPSEISADTIGKWMRRVMINQRIDRHRKRKLDSLRFPDRTEADHEDKMQLKQIRDFINRDAKRHPQSVKTFLLSMSGYSYREIAKMRKVSINSVGTAISKERKRILNYVKL